MLWKLGSSFPSALTTSERQSSFSPAPESLCLEEEQKGTRRGRALPKRTQGERARSSQTPRMSGWEQPRTPALMKRGRVGNAAAVPCPRSQPSQGTVMSP